MPKTHIKDRVKDTKNSRSTGYFLTHRARTLLRSTLAPGVGTGRGIGTYGGISGGSRPIASDSRRAGCILSFVFHGDYILAGNANNVASTLLLPQALFPQKF